jgi:hypothetical protein
MLFDIQLNKSDETVLQSLLDVVPEGRQIEYKRDLPKKDDYEDVKEFLKDVSAMANTIGGDIVYGVSEGKNANGDTVAQALDGIANEDADKVKLRLDQMIRANIKPTLIGYDIHPITLGGGLTIFVLRVHRSWNAPHVVEYKRHWRFYYRDSAGSHPMDVTELRHAITFAGTLQQRLEEFRLDRLARIAADPSLNPTAKIVIHIQPFDSVREDYEVELNKAFLHEKNLVLLRFDSAPPETRRNFDGLLITREMSLSTGYIQLFRSGAIEEVDASVMPKVVQQRNYIPSRNFEARVLNGVARRLGVLKDMNVQSPVLLHLTLLGVKGYRIGIQPDDWGDYRAQADQNPIDRDDLLLRGNLIENIQAIDNLVEYAGRVLRPVFDTVWNAAGFDRSLHYDNDGNWTGNLYP